MRAFLPLLTLILLANTATAQVPLTEGDSIAFAAFETPPSHRSAGAPDLSGVPHARHADFEEALALGPNFAGDGVLVTWGCGTECQTASLVANDGSIHILPTTASVGFAHRVESNLLVVNPPENVPENAPEWLETRFFVWEGHHFVEIDREGEVIDPQVGCGEAVQKAREAESVAPTPEL